MSTSITLIHDASGDDFVDLCSKEFGDDNVIPNHYACSDCYSYAHYGTDGWDPDEAEKYLTSVGPKTLETYSLAVASHDGVEPDWEYHSGGCTVCDSGLGGSVVEAALIVVN